LARCPWNSGVTKRYNVTFNECNEINYALRNIHAVYCISISLG